MDMMKTGLSVLEPYHVQYTIMPYLKMHIHPKHLWILLSYICIICLSFIALTAIKQYMLFGFVLPHSKCPDAPSFLLCVILYLASLISSSFSSLQHQLLPLWLLSIFSWSIFRWDHIHHGRLSRWCSTFSRSLPSFIPGLVHLLS